MQDIKEITDTIAGLVLMIIVAGGLVFLTAMVGAIVDSLINNKWGKNESDR